MRRILRPVLVFATARLGGHVWHSRSGLHRQTTSNLRSTAVGSGVEVSLALNCGRDSSTRSQSWPWVLWVNDSQTGRWDSDAGNPPGRHEESGPARIHSCASPAALSRRTPIKASSSRCSTAAGTSSVDWTSLSQARATMRASCPPLPDFQLSGKHDFHRSAGAGNTCRHLR